MRKWYQIKITFHFGYIVFSTIFAREQPSRPNLHFFDLFLKVPLMKCPIQGTCTKGLAGYMTCTKLY